MPIKLRGQALFMLLLLGGSFACQHLSGFKHTNKNYDEKEIAFAIPKRIDDREGWAADLVWALNQHHLRASLHNVCSAIAVIEQESGFKADPQVSNLAKLIDKRLRKYSSSLGSIGNLMLEKLLDGHSSNNPKKFSRRLQTVQTEGELDRVFCELLAYYKTTFPRLYSTASTFGAMLGYDQLAHLNPITTAGSMQVSVRFASEFSQKSVQKIREEIYSRRGGLYYGVARLLSYLAAYDTPLYRFADYNAGLYASRNAAVQKQLAVLTTHALRPDGDLLRYDARGNAQATDSESYLAALEFRTRYIPKLSAAQMYLDLEQEKSLAFEKTVTYQAIKRSFTKLKRGKADYAQLPSVDIISPKMARARSTSWYAQSVYKHYEHCVGLLR
jgi:hypothetical protein